MLEKMDDFFTVRVDGYDEHMKSNIEGADSFYNNSARKPMTFRSWDEWRH